MSYWILPESGIPISATTVQRITNDERSSEETKKRMNEYDERLKRVFDAKSVAITGLQGVPTSKVIDPFDEDPAFLAEFTRVIDDATLKHNDDISKKCIPSHPVSQRCPPKILLSNLLTSYTRPLSVPHQEG